MATQKYDNDVHGKGRQGCSDGTGPHRLPVIRGLDVGEWKRKTEAPDCGGRLGVADT